MAKIVVRLRNGRVIKGYASRFHSHNSDDLRMVEYKTEKVRVIPYSILKAIFFVYDFEGNPQHQSQKGFRTENLPGGKETVVVFEDGEELFGYVQMAHPDRNGFFVFPADSDGNNERIYVIRSAVSECREP